MKKIFFIIGCQRSGTTLVRLIVESHSQITCIDEPTSYSSLNLFKPTQSKINCFKVPLFTEQMNEDFFSDPSIDFIIPNIFHNVKLLFLIRDPRDTICSMMNLKQGNSTWLELWPARTIDFWRKTIPNFENKHIHDLKLISKSSEKLFANASFYWKIKNQSYLDYNNSKLNICGIKYEDLVTEPRMTIEKITNFLDLEWEDSLLSHHTLDHSQTNSDGITVGNINTKKSISPKSVNQYGDILSSDQQDIILSISGSLMKELKYKI